MGDGVGAVVERVERGDHTAAPDTDEAGAEEISQELAGQLKLFFFFLYFFRGYCVYGVPLPPLRSQHMVLCHPRWLPTSGLTEFALCWGGAGLELRTTDLQSGALPLSHLSS